MRKMEMLSILEDVKCERRGIVEEYGIALLDLFREFTDCQLDVNLDEEYRSSSVWITRGVDKGIVELSL